MQHRLVWLLAAVLTVIAVLCHIYYSHEAAQDSIRVGMTDDEVCAALGDRYCGGLQRAGSHADGVYPDYSGHATYEHDMDWLGRRTTVSVCYDRAGRVSGWEWGEKDRERISWRLSFYTLTGF